MEEFLLLGATKSYTLVVKRNAVPVLICDVLALAKPLDLIYRVKTKRNTLVNKMKWDH